MSNDIYYLIIMLVIGSIVLAYNLYQLWFMPGKYIMDLTNGVKNWWPFANFYRKWFASKTFLWIFRITYTIMLLALLLLLSLVLLGSMGMFP